jgi:hypothetical protein
MEKWKIKANKNLVETDNYPSLRKSFVFNVKKNNVKLFFIKFNYSVIYF